MAANPATRGFIEASPGGNPFPQLFHLVDYTETDDRTLNAATAWARATTGWAITAALGGTTPPPRGDIEALLGWIGPPAARTRFIDECERLLHLLHNPAPADGGRLF